MEKWVDVSKDGLQPGTRQKGYFHTYDSSTPGYSEGAMDMPGSASGPWNRPIARPPPVARPKVDNETYYRKCLTNSGLDRRDRNLSRGHAGQYGDVPPPRGFPLHHVLEEPAARKARNRTPKQAAKITNDGREHGQTVYDSANALNIWGGIAEEVPSGPMGPAIGFGEDAIELAKRCRDICQRSVDVNHSSWYSLWGSHRRMSDRPHWQNSSIEPLYQVYYVALA